MSDIAGPPAPKEVQPSVRGTDRAANVAKDPNNDETRSRDTPQDRTPSDQQESLRARDPAVSIAATAAHRSNGHEIEEKVARVDAEGRPIIVTESVTIALKPDAGLKPGDDVQLRVAETDTRITADLLRQNSNEIDPPIRLSVTIVEVHLPTNTTVQTTSSPAPLPETPYRPPQAPQVSTTSVQQPADEVALLVGGKSGAINPASTAGPQQIQPALQQQLDPSTGSVQSTIPRATSADLATLIQQQQSGSISVPAPPPATGVTSAVQSLAVPFAPATGPGVGPAVAALTLDGSQAIIQLLDPALSKISPVEIATVTNVQALSAGEARTIPVGAATLASIADPAGELARVETSRGIYILPAQTAASLPDELVRIVVDSNSGAQAPNLAGPQNQANYSAQFTATDTSTSNRVAVSLVPDAAAAPSSSSNASASPSAAQSGQIATATITAVQTTGAFLSASGPKTDLKITTDIGTLTLTVPSSFRPEVGAQLALSEPDIAPTTTPTAQTPSLTGTIPPVQTVDAAIASTTIAAHTPNLLASWPALEEGLAALAGSSQVTAGAESLTAKTAQGGGKLTNALLFFLSATGRGGPNAWIGPGAERALEKSSPSILKSLRSDLGRMASLPSEAIGEWRPIIVPFDARPSEVPLVAFLLQSRQDVDPDGQSGDQSRPEDDDDQNQRFLLQVQFSVLGDIQLDGRIGKTNFDLTVRSSNGFSSPLKQDLESLFYQALAANGFSGGLQFQENTAFDIDAAALIENHLLDNPAA